VREINGFTIQNGKNDEGDGGGIYMYNAEKTKIKNCIIQYNECVENDGGGIYIENSDNSFVENCTLQFNYSYAGSAVFIYLSDQIQMKNLYITNNNALMGTIFNYNSQAVYISELSINKNSAIFGAGLMITGDEETFFVFDPILRCSSYLNYGCIGTDLYFGENILQEEVYLDTLTVVNPNQIIVYSLNEYGDTTLINLDINYGLINQVSQDVYVNPNIGNDENSGISPDEPLKTISYAYKLIKSDETNPNTIHINSGLYSEYTNNEKAPFPSIPYVSLIGDSIDIPIIDLASSTVFTYAKNYAKNLSIKNLNIINNTSYHIPTIYYQNSRDFIIQNVSFKNLSSHNILSFPSATNYLLNELIFENNEGTSIGVNPGPINMEKKANIRNITIKNTFPYNNNDILSGWPITIAGINSGYDEYELSNIQITQNISAYDTDFPVPGKSAILISDNAHVKISNATIADNGFMGPYNGSIGALVLDDGAKVDLYNSILYGDTLSEVILQWGPPPHPLLNIAHSNIQGGEEGIVVNNGILNYLEGNQDTIPYFNDTSAYPYQLRWDSPLIDQGTPIYTEGMEPPYIKIIEDKICLIGIYGDSIWLPSTDLAGKPRIKGGRIDMGAYEYQDTATRINKYYQKDIENFTAKVFPNPFKNNLFVYYEQKEQTEGFNLFIYDVKGYEIRDLSNGYTLANKGRVIWDGKDEWGQEMPSGTYFLYGMIKERKVFSKKVVKK
jgi:parallel beta-helix repeat protein